MMTVFEALVLMISFATLIVVILSQLENLAFVIGILKSVFCLLADKKV